MRLVCAAMVFAIGCSSPKPPIVAAPASSAPPPAPIASPPKAPPAPACDPTIVLPEAPKASADSVVHAGPARPVASLPSPGAVEPSGAFDNVWNGSVFERGSFARKAGTQLVVPAHAVVELGAPPGKVEVYVEKRIHFRGHPPERMTQDSVSHNMGLATKVVGSEQLLSTYGEWDSRIEGAAFLLLLVRVPSDTPDVTKRFGLASDRSQASVWPDDQYAKAEIGRVGYWYGTTNPGAGWAKVAMTADAQRVSRTAGAEKEEEPDPRFAPPIPREKIQASVKCTWETKKSELLACKEEDPTASGWLEISWTMQGDGTVLRADIFVGTLKNTSFATCVQQRFAKWRFAEHTGGGHTERLEVPPSR